MLCVPRNRKSDSIALVISHPAKVVFLRQIMISSHDKRKLLSTVYSISYLLNNTQM